MTKRVKGRLLFFGIVLMIFTQLVPVNGQIQINSPYTRFGPGSLVENGMNPRISAMGGLYYGVQASNLINPANPASYAAFDSVSFIFDAGVYGLITQLHTSKLSDQGDYISLSHLMFGFPVTKWWKTSLGILPFSYVGYDIYVNEVVDDLGVENVYQGSGGYNQLYWGNAFKIYKGLSVGVNLKYMFGSVYRSRGITFPDSTQMKNTFASYSIRPRDIYTEFGVQYKARLPKDHFLVVGAMFSPQTDIHTHASYLVTTYFGDINTAQYSYDTIEYTLRKSGEMTIPIRTGGGFTIGKDGKWMAGADFMWQNWEKYRYFGESDSLVNRWNIAVGGEYIPETESISNYLQKMSYRAGFHYGMTQLYFNGQHINEFGLSFGVGLPIKKSKSMVNMSLDIGKRGTIQYNLIQENYIKFTIGVNVFENWFFKNKYF
jgi:hypothetical protein